MLERLPLSQQYIHSDSHWQILLAREVAFPPLRSENPKLAGNRSKSLCDVGLWSLKPTLLLRDKIEGDLA